MRSIATFILSISLLMGATTARAAGPTGPPLEPGWDTMLVAQAAESEEAQVTAEQESEEEPKMLEPVVVTASRIETPVSRIGSSVSVIPREQLEQLGSPTVVEALRQVPGLNLIQTGGFGGTTSVFTRGGRSDYTLIMIDGVPLTDQSGNADLAHLTIDNVERIEVIRGPQSALYGAEALSGVINIITKKGEGDPLLNFALQGGNLENNLESASLSGSTVNGFNYSVAASHVGTENLEDLDNDDYDNSVFSGRLGYEVEDVFALAFILRYQYADFGNPGPTQFLAEDPDDETEVSDLILTTLFDQPFTDWWAHSVQLSYFTQNYQNEDPVSQDPLFLNDMVSDYDADFERVAADYHHNFTLLEDHIITLGAAWEQEEADIDSTADFGFGPFTSVIDKQRHNLGFYGQAALSFWERLDLLAGVRYDDNSVFGSEISPRLAASYLVKETETRLKGSYGQGIKNPTFLDLYLEGFGNPDLEPEKSEAWDIGFEQPLLDGHLKCGLTYFHSDFDNLIATIWDPVSGATTENLRTAESEGVELELYALLPYHLTFRGAYTYTETEDHEGDRLLRVPRHLVSLNLNYSYDRLMLNLNTIVASDRRDSSFVFGVTDDKANGYVKMDIAGDYRLTDHFWLVARIDNLLDDEHYEQALGFENPGINFLAGVRGVF